MQQHSPTILKCNSHAHDPTLPNSNQLKLNLDKTRSINLKTLMINNQKQLQWLIHSHFSSSFNQIVNNKNSNKLLKLKIDAKKRMRDNETIDNRF